MVKAGTLELDIIAKYDSSQVEKELSSAAKKIQEMVDKFNTGFNINVSGSNGKKVGSDSGKMIQDTLISMTKYLAFLILIYTAINKLHSAISSVLVFMGNILKHIKNTFFTILRQSSIYLSMMGALNSILGLIGTAILLPLLPDLIKGISWLINKVSEFMNIMTGEGSYIEKLKTVGILIYDYIKNSISDINWSDVNEKVTTFINDTIVALDKFILDTDWVGIGTSIGTGIGNFVDGIDWKAYGKLMFDGFVAAFKTLVGIGVGLEGGAGARRRNKIAEDLGKPENELTRKDLMKGMPEAEILAYAISPMLGQIYSVMAGRYEIPDEQTAFPEHGGINMDSSISDAFQPQVNINLIQTIDGKTTSTSITPVMDITGQATAQLRGDT